MEKQDLAQNDKFQIEYTTFVSYTDFLAPKKWTTKTSGAGKSEFNGVGDTLILENTNYSTYAHQKQYAYVKIVHNGTITLKCNTTVTSIIDHPKKNYGLYYSVNKKIRLITNKQEMKSIDIHLDKHDVLELFLDSDNTFPLISCAIQCTSFVCNKRHDGYVKYKTINDAVQEQSFKFLKRTIYNKGTSEYQYHDIQPTTTCVKIEMVGAGGAGGGIDITNLTSTENEYVIYGVGGGGGSGSYVTKWIQLPDKQKLKYKIGTGGIGTSIDGVTGENTELYYTMDFSSSVMAIGGSGGKSYTDIYDIFGSNSRNIISHGLGGYIGDYSDYNTNDIYYINGNDGFGGCALTGYVNLDQEFAKMQNIPITININGTPSVMDLNTMQTNKEINVIALTNGLPSQPLIGETINVTSSIKPLIYVLQSLSSIPGQDSKSIQGKSASKYGGGGGGALIAESSYDNLFSQEKIALGGDGSDGILIIEEYGN